MELRTELLTQPQLEREISSIINFLQCKGKHDLVVSYGWGCDLDVNELYQEKPLPLLELHSFIVQSIQLGIFAVGKADLYINSQDEEIGFVLCHESNVHVTTQNRELAQEVASEWAERGYSYYEIALKS